MTSDEYLYFFPRYFFRILNNFLIAAELNLLVNESWQYSVNFFLWARIFIDSLLIIIVKVYRRLSENE